MLNIAKRASCLFGLVQYQQCGHGESCLVSYPDYIRCGLGMDCGKYIHYFSGPLASDIAETSIL